MGVNDKNVTIEGARIVFRNFAGREGQYNREGDRNFSIVLSDADAKRMAEDGWNVKSKPSKEEGEENFNHLPVTVGFNKGRPPRVVMVSSRGRTSLDEDTCDLLDFADIKNVDLIIRPYPWAVNGKTGIKAYLHAIYVTINEDALELKYADVPEAGSRSREEIELVELEKFD